MVISNAKYGKKPQYIKNKAYSVWEEDSRESALETGMDFVIPRYEELHFLNIEELAR